MTQRRNLHEIRLDIHILQGNNYDLDKKIADLINKIGAIWKNDSMTLEDEETIKLLSRKLIILGNTYESNCDQLIKLHREMSLTQIDKLDE